ncbi:MAG: hypothetical protein ACFFCS_26110 [Candidatus Hodarchaeota archaeon]
MIENANESMKLVLGEIGELILEILQLGPMNIEAICIITGLQQKCVEGRIPVLKSLDLIREEDDRYSINGDNNFTSFKHGSVQTMN